MMTSKVLRRACHYWLLFGLLSFVGSVFNSTNAASLLANGGFETGDFTGWSVATQGSGNWFIASSTQSPLNTGDTVRGASDGVFFAVTDQTRPGAYALTQTFTIPADAGFVELSFQMFVDNYGPRSITPTLSYNSGSPNQHARVDLLTASASAFDTSSASIVTNFYLGSDAGNPSHPYSFYRFNITSLVKPGETYQIRFADVAGQTILHQGVDAVSIVAEIPEPSNGILFASGLGLLLSLRQHLRNRVRNGNKH